ncbi:MAG: family 16 glycosylhydrolase [Bacteroidota bacterium]
MLPNTLHTLLLGLFLSLSSLSYAQPVQDDFEGNGTITTWFGDNCGVVTNFTNPVPDNSNPSSTVLLYDDQGGQFANVRFDVSKNFELSTYRTFSFKIYVPSSGLTGNQPNQVSLKLQDGNLSEPWSTQSEIIKPIVLDEWQVVSFNFATDSYINLNGGSPPPTQRFDFNRVLIQINGENNSDLVQAYIDDFQYDGNLSEETLFDQLVWSDEFDTDGPIDDTKWFHQTQLPLPDSWYNSEIQHYTNREENAKVENGILKITARKETFTDQGVTKQYTSARLNSKFAFTYGRVEIRAKLPFGVGTWPAIWMLGKNINEDGAYWDNEGFGTTPWPACGEIDIMEHWGHNQNFVQSAMHTPSSFGATENHGGRILPTASTAFHVYALEWTPEKMVFSVDDVIHYVYNPIDKNPDTWPFDAEQYLLLNVAIQESIIPTTFTQSAMEIDYVRVYQQSLVSTVEPSKSQLLQVFPNPVENELQVSLPKATSEPLLFQLYSLDGQLIRQFQATPTEQVVRLEGLGTLAAGSYLLSTLIDGQAYSVKLMKAGK